MRIQIPYIAVTAMYELEALLGQEGILGFPRSISLSHPRKGITETGDDLSQVVINTWRPGLYVRIYGTENEGHYGTEYSLIAGRLRFTESWEGRAVWDTITTRWQSRRAALRAKYGTEATGLGGRPIKGALIQAWRTGAEVFIVGQRQTDGSAPIPQVWYGKLPDEVVRLSQVPYGTCINEIS